MGLFRENRKKGIENGKKLGEKAIEYGEKMVQGVSDAIGPLVDIVTDDEDIQAAVEATKEGYIDAARDAHQDQVADKVDQAKQGLESNKGEIQGERKNMSDALDKVNSAKNATDLAKASASALEGKIKQTDKELEGMEKETETIEDSLDTKTKDLLSKIEALKNL